MFFGATYRFPAYKSQPFPKPEAAAVKRQFIGLNNVINKVNDSSLPTCSDVPSGKRHATENPTLEFVTCTFLRRRRLRFFAIISPLEHCPIRHDQDHYHVLFKFLLPGAIPRGT